MNAIPHQRFPAVLLALASLLCLAHASAQIPITKGQRVFSAGHSFHMFMPAMLDQLAKAAKIANHQQVGKSSIGGSYTHQHWNVPDEKNTLKKSLRAGEIDVLTLSPIYLPDD